MPARVGGRRDVYSAPKTIFTEAERTSLHQIKSLSLSSSHGNDDLSDLLVRFHKSISLRYVVERETLGNDRPQCARGEPIDDERLCALQPFGVFCDLEQLIPADRQVFTEQRHHWHRHVPRIERAILEEDAEVG